MKNADESENGGKARLVDVRRGVRWFAAEFLVVVAGILAALAIQAVYQARQDRNRQSFYLHQVMTDLATSEDVLVRARDREASITDGSALMWRTIHSSAPRPSDDTLAAWFSRSLAAPATRVVNGTLDALIANGDIALIRNDSLRSGLLRFGAAMHQNQAMLDRFVSSMLDLLMERNRRVDPIEIQPAYRDNWGMEAGHFPVKWTALLKDPSFNAFVATNWQVSVSRFAVIGAMLTDVRDIRRRIASYTGETLPADSCKGRAGVPLTDYAGKWATRETNVSIQPQGDSLKLVGYGMSGNFVNVSGDHFCGPNGVIDFKRDSTNTVIGFRIVEWGRQYDGERMK